MPLADFHRKDDVIVLLKDLTERVVALAHFLKGNIECDGAGTGAVEILDQMGVVGAREGKRLRHRLAVVIGNTHNDNLPLSGKIFQPAAFGKTVVPALVSVVQSEKFDLFEEVDIEAVGHNGYEKPDAEPRGNL